MSKNAPSRRLIALAVVTVIGFCGLGYRLLDLQVMSRSEHERAAQNNTERTVLKKPRRGDIRSARGDLLATSIRARTICADPSMLAGHHVEMAQLLAPLLKTELGPLVERLQPRVSRYLTNGATVVPVPLRYTVLKRKVRVEDWERIHAAITNATFGFNPTALTATNRTKLLELRAAVKAEEDEIRTYPNGRLAAHVLGYVADDDVDHSLVGRDGIEWNFNEQLTGMGGWRETERDHSGHELVVYRRQDVEARDGCSVFLTLDALLQQVLESEMAEAMEKLHPKSITGIIVRPRTGEILALANLPNYDPNQIRFSSEDSRRNRVLGESFEPGSTFKVVVVSGALNEGTVTLRDIFDCEHGLFNYGGHPLHDHDPYGLLTVEQIITKSSNIGAAKVGIKIGPQTLFDYMGNFGFGTRTGIPLQGEEFGIVRPVAKWSKVSIARIPMGQGVSVTRLQMLMAMAAIANEGVLMRPLLVDRIEDPDGRIVAKSSPQPVRQVISKETARLMVQALKTVTTSEGTAPKAALEHYSTAGKTGTAQKVIPGGLGYYQDRFISSFVGFLPADHPEICISIVLDEPPHGQHFGGICAAPVFRRVAERAASYLNIKPDLGEATVVPGASVGEGAVGGNAGAAPHATVMD